MKLHHHCWAVPLFLLLLSSCGGGSGETPSVSALTATQNILFRIVDSRSLALVSNREVTLDLSGSGSSKLADSNGVALASASVTQNGLIALTVVKGVTPSTSAPIEVTVTVRAKSLVPNSRLVTIDSTASRVVDIGVISTATDSTGSLIDVQPGVSGKVATADTTAGVLSGNATGIGLKSAVPATTFAGLAGFATPTPSASAEFDSDTLVGRWNGTAIQPAASGVASLVTVVQSPLATESLSSFPTGMINVRVRDSSGATRTLPLVRVDAYASFSLSDAASLTIDRFNKSARFTVEIPLNEKDDAGKTPQTGGTVAVARYDNQQGVWLSGIAGTVTATDTARNMATVAFASDTPAIFAVLRQPAACGTSVRMTRQSGDTRPLNVTVLTPGFITGDINITGSSYSTASTPDAEGAVFVTLPGGVNVVGQAVIQKTGSCPHTVEVPIAAPRPAGRVTVSTREACPSGSNNRPVSTSVSLLRADQSLATTVQTDATGNARFDYVEVGQYALAAVNPRLGTVMTTPVVVADGQAADVPFVFQLTCN